VLIEARGAPVDQGVIQGRAQRGAILLLRRRLRRRYGFFSWREALYEAEHGPGRNVRWFLPQLHERLYGIAMGAGVPARVLDLAESFYRVPGVATAKSNEVEARLEIPEELQPLLVLRRSRPDAVGFASVEFTCAPWAGCLAGVNDPGIAVVVTEDRGLGDPSLRLLAQDVLLRTQDLDAAVDHLRLRASYSGGNGSLLIADAGGRAVSADLARGHFAAREVAYGGTPTAQSTLRIDTAARTLTCRDAAGVERCVVAEPEPEEEASPES
jgi:hypothetical protein